MAYGEPVHCYHLVNWNIKGKGGADERKNAISAYLSGLKPPPDILFLQEVQWAPTKKRGSGDLRTHLSALSDHHELSHFCQEYDNCYNCVIFDKRKFEALPEADLQKPLAECFKLLDERNEWGEKGFRTSQENQMRNRMCVVVLVDKSREGCKFIAASLHNLNKDEHSNVNMAELFLQLLELLGDKMEYPVILAGDFNADIQERETSFTIPKYMRTLHRWNLNVIDFFLCRPGRNATVVLDNVEADLAHDVKNADQMVELDKVSNHDPL